MIEKSAQYKEKYGAWAGFPKGHAPDFSRCCERIFGDRSSPPGGHQCQKKRGHGPDGAYCKQHDPDAVRKRDAASRARANAKWNKERYRIHGNTFFDALQKIADGHNDARGLAQKVISDFKRGEYR